MRFGSLRLLKPDKRRLGRSFVATLLLGSLLNGIGWGDVAQAQMTAYCQLSAEAIAQKNTLRQAALQGDRDAQNRYKTLLVQHAEELRRCRSQTWPQNQALWVRLYPCDARPGAMEALLDRIVNRGYNRVYIEAFYNGQVLLPAADNPTSWPSTIRTPGHENTDLLAMAIEKGKERGLEVYAWMFTMNFGYAYAQRPGSEQVLARNGQGQTSLTFHATAGLSTDIGGVNSEETFVDPYSLQAKRDYYTVVQAILKRRPDGVLFDYIRYPRGSGAASVAGRVQDLWVYGPSAQQALFDRALNQSGQELIRRFVNRGYITTADVAAMRSQFPQEREPMWQGRTPFNITPAPSPDSMRPALQTQLWQLTVAHAIQGVIDFLAMAVMPVQRQGARAGAVFFPDGNQQVGQSGYDSRLQPWDRFPSNIEWHPMSYGTCGNTGCITAQVQRVVSMAPPGTQVMPVIAGTWGQPLSGRPSLEAQMQAIRQVAPQINSVSHFAYSWQEPQSDRERKFCQL